MGNDKRLLAIMEESARISNKSTAENAIVPVKHEMDRSFLRQAICWAEILEKPVCRRRRERNWQSR